MQLLMNYQVMLLLILSYLCGMRTDQVEEHQLGEALADSQVPASRIFSPGIFTRMTTVSLLRLSTQSFPLSLKLESPGLVADK